MATIHNVGNSDIGPLNVFASFPMYDPEVPIKVTCPLFFLSVSGAHLQRNNLLAPIK